MIPFADAVSFVKEHAIKGKQKEVLTRMERYKDKFTADMLINMMVNYEALKASNSTILRDFLVHHGVDYSIQDNAFGWNERMIVLFNMNKIVKKEIIRGGDKIETFDLPKEFV